MTPKLKLHQNQPKSNFGFACKNLLTFLTGHFLHEATEALGARGKDLNTSFVRVVFGKKMKKKKTVFVEDRALCKIMV